MAKAILGRKLGMTQIFTEEGRVVPVTVVESGNNFVLQNKTDEGKESVLSICRTQSILCKIRTFLPYLEMF